MPITLAAFVALAASCAPTVAVETLAAVAQTESRLEPLAIGDNTSRQSHRPADLADAVALANGLLAQGHSIDTGLLQINSGNLRWLGLSVADTFDPCKAMAAGARVLAAGYKPAGQDEAAQQEALRAALSAYNTGSPVRGIANGYVVRVQASAEQIVPALRVQGVANAPAVPRAAVSPSMADNGPPAWDMWGRAEWEQRQHAPQPQPAPEVTTEPPRETAYPVPAGPEPRQTSGETPAAWTVHNLTAERTP